MRLQTGLQSGEKEMNFMKNVLVIGLFVLLASQAFVCTMPVQAQYYESIYARKEKYIPERILVKIRSYAEKRR